MRAHPCGGRLHARAWKKLPTLITTHCCYQKAVPVARYLLPACCRSHPQSTNKGRVKASVFRVVPPACPFVFSHGEDPFPIVLRQPVGKWVSMPRIHLCSSDVNEMIPFQFKWKQFPIRLSFTMTVNISLTSGYICRNQCSRTANCM
jgi:hypothetical protein